MARLSGICLIKKEYLHHNRKMFTCFGRLLVVC